MGRKSIIFFVAILLGAADALIFKAFEFAVNNGTNFIWNDVFGTGIHRRRVVPLAVGLSIGLSLIIKVLRQKRIVPPEPDSLKLINDEPVRLQDIGIIALIGLCSLLAGASLGPEAPLMAICASFGIWVAITAKQSPDRDLLAFASVGALLVAFLGSILPALLPIMLLRQKKQPSAASTVIILLACFSSYGTLWLMDRAVAGYGSISIAPDFHQIDLLIALILGVVATAVGRLQHIFIIGFSKIASMLNRANTWIIPAVLLGLVIGVLYLIGGESVQFSGSEGSKLLAHHTPVYSALALAGLVVIKLLVTSWSLASGYRGGLVFPSIYAGLAIGLVVETLYSGAGPGVVVGSIAGIIGSMTNPAAAFIFITSILPIKLVGVAIAGIAGSAIGNRLFPNQSTS